MARSGVHPTRWELALQMLLSKLRGECSIENCRYVILFEADLNQHKHHFIGGEANDALDQCEGLPDDIFSR